MQYIDIFVLRYHISFTQILRRTFVKTQSNNILTAASVVFIVGIVILTYPVSQDELSILPQTGIIHDLEITQTIDNPHVQIDDPATGAQEVNITLKASNISTCKIKPKDVVLVLDNSTNALSNFQSIKIGVEKFINHLPDNSQVGLITTVNKGEIKNTLSTNREEVINSVNNMDTSGESDLSAGLSLAYEEIQSQRHKEDHDNKIVIISTDNIPDISESIDIMDFAKNVGTEVYFLNLGDNNNEEQLNKIASEDKYVNVTSQKLPLVLESLAQSYSNMYSNLTIANSMSGMKDKSSIIDLMPQADIANENYLLWNIGTLKCRESAYVRFKIKVKEDLPDMTIISNAAVLLSPIVKTDAITSEERIYLHSPNLTITKTDNRDTVNPGSISSYIINIKNTGSGNAYGVKIFDEVDPNLEIIPESISNAQSTTSGIVWDNNGLGFKIYGTYDPGIKIEDSQLNFNYTTKIKQVDNSQISEISNVVKATTSKGKTYEAIDRTSLANKPDLEVTKSTVSDGEIKPGSIVHYELTVINLGNAPAHNVILQEDLPFGISNINADDGIIMKSSIIWNLNDMSVNQTITKAYSFYISDKLNADNITFTTKVKTDDAEPNQSDNSIIKTIKFSENSTSAANFDKITTSPIISDVTNTKVGEIAGVQISKTSSLNAFMNYARIIFGIALTLPLPLLLLFRRDHETV